MCAPSYLNTVYGGTGILLKLGYNLKLHTKFFQTSLPQISWEMHVCSREGVCVWSEMDKIPKDGNYYKGFIT